MLKKLAKNEKKALMLIRSKETVSRADIVESLKLTQPTASRIIESLLNEEFIYEVGFGESTGGRRPTLLKFNPNSFFSVGIELGRNVIKVALINLDGELINIVTTPAPIDSDEDSSISLLKDIYRKVVNESGIEPHKILGTGIGIPGPIKILNGSIITPTNFKGRPMPLITELEDSINGSVIIEKDANVSALAEKWFGHGKQKKNFMYVLAGEGIGCGLIINNQLFKGKDGEAGGLGHTTVNIFGEKCSCGNYGCLESIVSISKVEKRIREQIKVTGLGPKESKYFRYHDVNEIDYEMIVNAYYSGSELAKNVLEEYGSYLGIGVANAVSFFNPDVVIMGGSFGSLEVVKEAVKRSLFSKVIGSSGKIADIYSSELNESVVRGAAALVIEKSFSIYT